MSVVALKLNGSRIAQLAPLKFEQNSNSKILSENFSLKNFNESLNLRLNLYTGVYTGEIIETILI